MGILERTIEKRCRIGDAEPYKVEWTERTYALAVDNKSTLDLLPLLGCVNDGEVVTSDGTVTAGHLLLVSFNVRAMAITNERPVKPKSVHELLFWWIEMGWNCIYKPHGGGWTMSSPPIYSSADYSILTDCELASPYVGQKYEIKTSTIQAKPKFREFL